MRDKLVGKSTLLLCKIAPCVSVLEAGPPHLVMGFASDMGPIGEHALALHTELVVLAQPEDQIFIVFIYMLILALVTGHFLSFVETLSPKLLPMSLPTTTPEIASP